MNDGLEEWRKTRLGEHSKPELIAFHCIANTWICNFIFYERSSSPRPKQEVVFHLNENLAKTTKSGEKEEKIPLEHKFVMTPLGSQAMYILKQSEENSKGIFKV